MKDNPHQLPIISQIAMLSYCYCPKRRERERGSKLKLSWYEAQEAHFIRYCESKCTEQCIGRKDKFECKRQKAGGRREGARERGWDGRQCWERQTRRICKL